MTPPIILSLAFDAQSATHFQGLRHRYFPPALNRVPAHLALFHHLPGDEQTSIMQAVTSVAARAAFTVRAVGLIKLGRGVAFRIESPALCALRSQLAADFETWLTPQDRAPFRPHVTIQNKVTPAVANALFAELSSRFQPFEARAEGIAVWHYVGGPWSPLAVVPFSTTDA